MVNYGRGKVYQIIDRRCTADDPGYCVYVGATTQLLTKRWYGHKNPLSGQSMQITRLIVAQGAENFRIVLVEKVPCKDREELNMWHELWRQKLGPTHNEVRAHVCPLATVYSKFGDDVGKVREILNKFDMLAVSERERAGATCDEDTGSSGM